MMATLDLGNTVTGGSVFAGLTAIHHGTGVVQLFPRSIRLRAVQRREQVVEGERYRLTLDLDGKLLRAVDTVLSYKTSGTPPAPAFVGPTSAQCPVAMVTIPAP